MQQIKDVVKPTTHECYRSNLENYVIPELGSHKLDELNKGAIKDFIAKIRGGRHAVVGNSVGIVFA